MSVEAAASLPRTVVAPASGRNLASAADEPPVVTGGAATAAVADAAAADPQALPPVIRDAQGREYQLQQDPVSGHPQYRHAGEQRDAAGNSLTLEILIDLAPDGSFSRRTTQLLAMSSGDVQQDQTVASFSADGLQVGEVTDAKTRQGAALTTEHTVSSFTNGELTGRETDVTQHDEATDAKTGEKTTVGSKIHGTWDNGGAPITDATIPTVDRTDDQLIQSPGQGINKDTDRTIAFTRHASGPVSSLDWDDAGTLTVRFEGHKGQYIEREMKVPLDQVTGEPDMSKAETVREDDHQNLVNKGLMQARIWGGLASNLSWIAGVNFARGGLGKGLLAFSAAASGAQFVGEGHAIATKRNDGDWTRLALSAYDMVLTGALAAYMSGRNGLAPQAMTLGQRTGLTALGATGLAANGANLLGANPIGAEALMQRLTPAHVGAALQQPAHGRLGAQLGMEPRFDAAAAVHG